MMPTDLNRLPIACPAPSGEASTSVQPPETNLPDSERQTEWGGFVTSDDSAVLFRHSGWAHTRRRIRQALDDLHTSPRRLSRFDLCGSDPWIAVDENDPTNLTILTNHCHSRWCVPCSRERASRITGNLTAKIALCPVRFLTLTMKHSNAPLSQQINRIYACFRRLRRLPFWKAAVDGGAAILEIKRSWRDDLWHVHLHCLIQGRYCRHEELKAAWWRITGDSNVVDIRPVHNTRQATAYLAKYVTKPIANTIINKPDALQELIGACSRRRLVLTWGTWRGLQLSKKLDSVTWKSLCPLEILCERVAAEQPEAIATLAKLLSCQPRVLELVARSPPPTHPDPDLDEIRTMKSTQCYSLS